MVVMSNKKSTCFVIMPIGELESYENEHFKKVYNNIFKPAIESAGYTSERADNTNASNMIQADIVKKLIDSPMVLCDLSTHNPNVLFELGIRQAFDKPVVLVQEEGTSRIFDISTIRTISYRKERKYDEVLIDREKIKKAIIDTEKDNMGINSIIKLINIEPASPNHLDSNTEDKTRLILYSIQNTIEQIKNELINNNPYTIVDDPILYNNSSIISEVERIENKYEALISNEKTTKKDLDKFLSNVRWVQNSINMYTTTDSTKLNLFRRLNSIIRKLESMQN